MNKESERIVAIDDTGRKMVIPKYLLTPELTEEQRKSLPPIVITENGVPVVVHNLKLSGYPTPPINT